jgi:ribosomal protein S12 methylthiotransferase accessory factor
MTAVDRRRLLDARTGLVRRLELRPADDDLPRALHLVRSVLADSTRFGPWPCDPSGSGCAFWDRSRAEEAAIGEAVERYCGNLVPPALVRASFDELTGQGQAALDPAGLALYSPEQYAQRGFPFVPFTASLRVRWTRGNNLLTHEPVWVPASLVWVTYPEVLRYREPPTNGPVYAGIAAGPTSEAAQRSALLELIERDSVALSWASGMSLATIEPPAGVACLARGSRGALSTTFYACPTEWDLPVIAAVTVHERLGITTMGTACRLEPEAAMLKALSEALKGVTIMRELDDPSSSIMRTAERMPASPLKRWRPARDYLSAYRPDWRDVVDPSCHLQIYLDPRLRARLHRELGTSLALGEGERPTAPWMEHAPAGVARRRVENPGSGCVRAIAARLARRGIPVYGVDVTTDDVRSAGLHVVRLIAPGLYSNAPAAFPFLGGNRLARLTASLARPPRLLPLPH